jgi:hypothetical protein
MRSGERLSLEQIRAFLKASEEFRFEGSKRKEVYEWVTQTLVEHEYSGQRREAKGVLRQYLGKMTGLSRAQVTRLIGRMATAGGQGGALAPPLCFAQAADTSSGRSRRAHETLSGPATQAPQRGIFG